MTTQGAPNGAFFMMNDLEYVSRINLKRHLPATKKPCNQGYICVF